MLSNSVQRGTCRKIQKNMEEIICMVQMQQKLINQTLTKKKMLH